MTDDSKQAAPPEPQDGQMELAPTPTNIARMKESLRDRIRAKVDKIPPEVASGSIQTTREWLAFNERARVVAKGGRKRMSRYSLLDMAERLENWSTPKDEAC